MSPFNWRRSIVGGTSGAALTINALTLGPSAGFSIASIIAGIVGGFIASGMD